MIFFGSLIEGFRNVVKEPQISDDVDKVGHLNRSDTLSIYFVEDSITYFAHTYYANENALKDDICLFESEIKCFNASSLIDYSLFM